MTIFIEWSVSEKCKNPFAIEICHKCNACGRWNKETMLQDRLRVLEEYLEDRKSFDMWSKDEEMRKIQERNLKESIKYIEKEINKIKKQLIKKGDNK